MDRVVPPALKRVTAGGYLQLRGKSVICQDDVGMKGLEG